MKSNIVNFIKNFLNSHAGYRTERQRVIVFILGEIMLIFGLPMHLFGIIGSDNGVLRFVTLTHCGLAVVLAVLYLYKHITIVSSLYAYAAIEQAILSVKIIYLTMTMPDNYAYYIVFNEFLSFMVIFVLVLGYIVYMPVIITIASTFTALVPIIVTGDGIYMQVMVFFLFIEIFTCLLGYMLWKNLNTSEQENVVYKGRESQILNTFGVTKAEFFAYINLATKSDHKPNGVCQLFNMLDSRHERNIINAVKIREQSNKYHKEKIAEVFPALTPTEVEVCSHILCGKTQKDIARLTNKNENNVSTVRTHIRRKLGLIQGDDLRQHLEDMMNGKSK